ncbi:hypothetical protein FZX01_15375 [Listeria monocytogenes]|uniref:hypothetical protein n=1 Tax=Listeria monocytogenes TaxID=1639 RepID=UPI0011EB9894|nr:hypothetical protein [Listeria monocytogenes]TYU82859.1 hypothetical protein FZX01_15375 [Listeria monocytogenes]
MLIIQLEEQTRIQKLQRDQDKLATCLNDVEDDNTIKLLSILIKEVKQEKTIEETEVKIKEIQMCLNETKEISFQNDYKTRITYLKDQLYELKRNKLAHVAEAEGRFRAQLAHLDHLDFVQQKSKHEEKHLRVIGIMPNIPRKQYNRKKYKEKPDYSKIISPLEIEKRGCIFFTKDHKEFIHLYNDLLINPKTMEAKTFREVLASTIHIRNSEGDIIFKYAKKAFRPVRRVKVK